MEWSLLGYDATAIARVLFAGVLSIPIGLEREVKGKPVGVRTHFMLAAAAAALGWLSVTAAEGDPSADPTRIASYTVAGISFLGGGVIVGIQARVHGLTTAVALFTVTAMGLLSGMGYPDAAAGLMVVTLMTLAPLSWLKDNGYGRWIRGEVTMHLVLSHPRDVSAVEERLSQIVELRSLTMQHLSDDQLAVHLTLRGLQRDIINARSMLAELDGVRGLVLVGADRGDQD